MSRGRDGSRYSGRGSGYLIKAPSLSGLPDHRLPRGRRNSSSRYSKGRFYPPGAVASARWYSSVFLRVRARLSPLGLPALFALLLREEGLEKGIKVTIRYKDLGGGSYATEWMLYPLLFVGRARSRFSTAGDEPSRERT